MSFSLRHQVYLYLASGLMVLHLIVAALAKPSFGLTMFGDALPCALLLVAFLTTRENFRRSPGILPVFWKLFAAGLFCMMVSEGYWFYYDALKRSAHPSPVPGDALFLLANVIILSAIALRPQSATVGRDFRFRGLDFALLTLWWFTLYGYYGLPWQLVLHEFAHYNPAYYVLAFIQHLVIVTALIFLWRRNREAWRSFYALLLLAFVLIAGGTLLLGISIDRGWYYSGSFYDTPFLLSVYLFSFAAALGPFLGTHEELAPNRELVQSVWTARFAMMGILSLPIIALFGFYEKDIPSPVATFRLRLVFGAMTLLGALVYWKLILLARELGRLVRLTKASIKSLKEVQLQVAHAEKLVALGRLAAGATHEISNPLTAILGYSELLTDIPSLSPDDRQDAHVIRQQVHRAQAAVNSLRDTLRSGQPSPSLAIDKKPVS